jgi:uncharacterized membrane protein
MARRSGEGLAYVGNGYRAREVPVPDAVTLIAEWSAASIEMIGIGVLCVTAAYSICLAVWSMIWRHVRASSVVHQLRTRLGQGILVGLEFLVAADIIYTVAIDLSLRTVGVLAAIVLIRTFLSFTLEVELSGRWPWEKDRTPSREL